MPCAGPAPNAVLPVKAEASAVVLGHPESSSQPTSTTYPPKSPSTRGQSCFGAVRFGRRSPASRARPITLSRSMERPRRRTLAPGHGRFNQFRWASVLSSRRVPGRHAAGTRDGCSRPTEERQQGGKGRGPHQRAQGPKTLFIPAPSQNAKPGSGKNSESHAIHPRRLPAGCAACGTGPSAVMGSDLSARHVPPRPG